jgi:hypothetical protein
MYIKGIGVFIGILAVSIFLCIGTIAATYISCPADSCGTNIGEAADIVEESSVVDAAPHLNLGLGESITDEPVNILTIVEEIENAAFDSHCEDDGAEAGAGALDNSCR